MNRLLGDPKTLTQFLEKVSSNKGRVIENLISVNDIFEIVEEINGGHSGIYWNDDEGLEILVQFEYIKK